MSDNKKLNKKPKLNSYWIYGLIIVIFLAINIFSGGMSASSGTSITQDKFFEYFEKGEVEEILILNRREAQVFLLRKQPIRKSIKNL